MRTKDQFLRHVQPEPNSGCWLWVGAVINVGYGKFQKGKLMSAHRASYEIFCGDIPDGLHVLHKCDNPLCVNPAHLTLGTHADNMKDRQDRGRTFHPTGESHGRAKLKEKDVLAIRSSNKTQAELARFYKVSPSLICQIKHNLLWAKGEDAK